MTDPTKIRAEAEDESPWPNGPTNGLFPIITIGYEEDGLGEIDFARNHSAHEQMSPEMRKIMYHTLKALMKDYM